jgi:hypothetical protein
MTLVSYQGPNPIDIPDMVLVRKAIQRFTCSWIALISQFPVTIDGMVTTPSQFVADRGLAGAGNTFNQIISDINLRATVLAGAMHLRFVVRR